MQRQETGALSLWRRSEFLSTLGKEHKEREYNRRYCSKELVKRKRGEVRVKDKTSKCLFGCKARPYRKRYRTRSEKVGPEKSSTLQVLVINALDPPA